jgi:hypothetical protein
VLLNGHWPSRARQVATRLALELDERRRTSTPTHMDAALIAGVSLRTLVVVVTLIVAYAVTVTAFLPLQNRSPQSTFAWVLLFVRYLKVEVGFEQSFRGERRRIIDDHSSEVGTVVETLCKTYSARPHRPHSARTEWSGPRPFGPSRTALLPGAWEQSPPVRGRGLAVLYLRREGNRDR